MARGSLAGLPSVVREAIDPGAGWQEVPWEGHPMADIPEVLFVCTHNAGRSQMAAALLDHLAAGSVRVTSAGSQPASQLNPAVVQAMAEVGLDISREFSKPLATDKVQAADVVITMGCGDTCPVFPAARKTALLPRPALR